MLLTTRRPLICLDHGHDRRQEKKAACRLRESERSSLLFMHCTVRKQHKCDLLPATFAHNKHAKKVQI